MGVGASGATLEIQLVADVARLKRDMAAMQETIGSATASAGRSFAGMSTQTVNAAAQMAAAAQASARAAVGMGAGLRTAGLSAQNARIVTLEMFHVTRSLTEQLAMGVSPARAFGMEIGRIATAVQYSGGSVGGLIKQFAAWAGIVKVTQDAELAEAAAQKEMVAEAIKTRVERAAATLQAREVDVALAQAQLASAATADAEAAAQTRLVKALRAVEVAAGKATVANDALTTAQAEASAAAAASNAKTVRSLSGMGVGLGVVAAAAAVAFAGVKSFQDQVGRSGELDKFAEGLRLTDAQIKAAGGSVKYLSDRTREVTGLTVTFGNAMEATLDVILERAGVTAKGFQSSWQSALATVADFGKFTISVLLAGFAALVELTMSTGKNFVALQTGNFAALTNPLADMKKQFFKTFNDVEVGFDKVGQRAIDLRKKQLQAESDANKPPREKRPRIQGDHGLAEALAELDAQIRGQTALAAAYQISDAAAIKAEALQKAEEQAIRHKGQIGVFYEKELALAVAQRAADGAKAMADIHAEAGARSVVNDLVEQGTISYRDMGRALEDQTKKRQLMAALAVAEDKGWLEQAANLRTEIYNLAFAQKVLNDEVDRGDALAELGKQNEQHTEAMALLQRESELTGVNKDKRDEILKLLQKELELRQQFPGMTQEEIDKVVAQTAAEDNLRRHLDQVEAGMDQLRQTGEQMLDTVFNIDNWKDPLDLALQLVKQLEQSFVTLAFANPLKNSLFGENLPTLNSVGGVGGFFKGVAGQNDAQKASALAAAGAQLGASGITLNTASVGLTSAATIWQAVVVQLDAAAAALAAAGAANAASGIVSAFGGAAGAAAGTSSFLAGFQGFGGAALATGGPVSGPGSSTSDSIPLMGSNGEYMIQAAAVRKFGVRFFDALNEGQVPHMKSGGLLGFVSLLSPMAFLATHGAGKGPLGPLGFLSPMAGLINMTSHGGSSGLLDALKFLSPAAFLGSRLIGGDGHGSSAQDAANSNTATGDTHIHVIAPNTGDPLKDRQTGTQFGAGIAASVAAQRRKGTM